MVYCGRAVVERYQRTTREVKLEKLFARHQFRKPYGGVYESVRSFLGYFQKERVSRRVSPLQGFARQGRVEISNEAPLAQRGFSFFMMETIVQLRMFRALLTTLLFALLSVGFVLADNARDIQFSSDKADYDEANNLIRLVGDVVITSEGSELTAPYVEYHTDREYAEFIGGVKMVGEQSTATGKEMKVWYAESRARLDGEVRLVSQGVGNESGEPTVILCDRLDYNWSSEEGQATGGVKMRQGDKRAYADRAEIYQKRSEVLLIGSVRVEQGDGDWLTAERAIYDTERQTVRAEGRVVAKTRLESQGDGEEEVSVPVRATLPEPILIEPTYELLPMRRLPSVPLPWLDRPR